MRTGEDTEPADGLREGVAVVDGVSSPSGARTPGPRRMG
ncbi:hypothetical protein SXIM_00620 [Streptomyces xiamenensis]|uniref:Uncharacterized protein n=1 Tax=Streptomyces xiamenensis TaxID=408015 RepID=A0A0F7CMN0_9ACTN|nr:hypothetical protein SXIM_00620 [Streptomyces xiamenensis]